jgi:hypothetical protein
MNLILLCSALCISVISHLMHSFLTYLTWLSLLFQNSFDKRNNRTSIVGLPYEIIYLKYDTPLDFQGLCSAQPMANQLMDYSLTLFLHTVLRSSVHRSKIPNCFLSLKTSIEILSRKFHDRLFRIRFFLIRIMSDLETASNLLDRILPSQRLRHTS